MRYFLHISTNMKRFAHRKQIMVLFAMLIIILAFMEKGPISSAALKEYSGGAGMLDMKFGYDQPQVYKLLGDIGPSGRQVYSGLLGLDFWFAVVFMLFQSLTLTALFKKACMDGRFTVLNMLPVLRSGLDIIENIFILLLIHFFPVKLPVIAGIASAVTMVKWMVYAGIIVLFFTLGALVTQRKLMEQFSTLKRSETL